MNHVWTRNIRELFKTIKDAINITPGKKNTGGGNQNPTSFRFDR